MMRLKDILAERKRAAAQTTTTETPTISDDQADVSDEGKWDYQLPISPYMALFEGCTEF